jgi:hypothetical protein
MRNLLLLAGLCTLSLSAHAANAHVHGEGKLEVVIDKDAITINLELPMDAAVGFERAPRNDKEKSALSDAQRALKDTATMFVPTPAAGCTAQPAKVAMPEFGGRRDDNAHADIDATYAFRCASPGALKSIETGIFKSFRRLYRLEAQRVGPTGQGAMRLTPKTPALSW